MIPILTSVPLRNATAVLFALSVPTGAAQARRLIPPLAPGRDVVQFALTPAGDRVLYRADADRDQVFELYSLVLDDMSIPVKLHAALPSGRTVFGFRLDPAGTRALYHSNPASSGRLEIFSVPVDGSQSPVKLNGPFGSTTGGVQSIPLFGEPLYQATPDGTRVVFVAALENSAFPEIYSAPIDGSAAAVKLNPPLGLTDDKYVSNRSHFHVSADSTRVVYQADLGTTDTIELYSSPVDGSSPAVLVNGALVPGGNVITDEFAITGDSAQVVYLADQEVDERDELYSAPIGGGSSSVKLSAAPVAGGEVLRGFALTPGGRALYRADQETDGAIRLYSVPVDGSLASVAIGGSSEAGRTVLHFALSPDGNQVAYCADEEVAKRFEIYRVATDGTSAAVDLGGAFPSAADVYPGIRFAPDGSRILFVGDADENQRFDLFVVPADGSTPPVRLHPSQSFTDVRAFEFTPDGSRVVFLADVAHDEVPELFEVPIEGGTCRRLCPGLVEGREVLSRFHVRDDMVLYLSDQRQDDVFELYRGRHPGNAATGPAPTQTVTRAQ